MVRENLFIYLVEGFIGLVFTLYALGVLMPVIVLYENVSSVQIALTAVVFFVGIASFAGIPVLRKSSAKGIKLFMIISVVQIGTIICCHIAKTPGMGGPSFANRNPSSIEIVSSGGEGGGITFVAVFSIFVLAILIYFYSKKRQGFQ